MKALSLFCLIALSACSYFYDDIFITKNLPKAKLHQKYDAEIKMKEQAIIEDKFSIETDLNKNSGLTLLANQGTTFSHSTTVITGIPQQTGTYNIHISGVARSGLKKFDKIFILIVEK